MVLPFTREELAAAVADGQVTARPHPTLPYTIYNYSPEIQYTNRWNRVTLACRGLILDDDFNTIARPWEKFFNLGQVDLPIQFTDPVEVMDKADGSLGILYPMPQLECIEVGNAHLYREVPGFAIATRGSFTSEQALHATKLWKREYEDYYNDGPEAEALKGLTILFEIIYPQNRIVLDYGDMDDLILLGAVDNERGYYYGANQTAAMISWPGPVVETMEFNTITDALGKLDRKNSEGYVIRSHNFMVKLKQPDYLELHRLVTNASPKTVWEQLRVGKSKSQIISAFPDEFHSYIGSMIDPLLQQFGDRSQEIMDGFFDARNRIEWQVSQTVGREESITRRDYAREFSKHKDKKYFFLLLDGKSIRDVLWTELKPRDVEVRLDDAGDPVPSGSLSS